MTDLPTLTSLLERVEKAEGPDRELDNDIFRALALTDEWSGKRVSKWFIDAGTGWWSCHTDDGWLHQEVQLSPRYSSSLDAALALVEEKLPGCNGLLMFGEPHRNPIMRLAPLYPDGRHPVEAGGATLPLAVLSALLRALIAQKETADV
jgi:hypothetical protein